MVATGYPWNIGITSEVIDLMDEHSICDDMSSSPYLMESGTGGLINKDPLVCGGFSKNGSFLNECFLLGKNQTITLTYKRYLASSILVNDQVSLPSST